jgi:hypothetical protein
VLSCDDELLDNYSEVESELGEDTDTELSTKLIARKKTSHQAVSSAPVEKRPQPWVEKSVNGTSVSTSAIQKKNPSTH